jgi:hypothetical protein
MIWLCQGNTFNAVRSWVHQGRIAPALGFIKVRLPGRDLETRATTIPFQARAAVKRPSIVRKFAPDFDRGAAH